MKALSHVVFSFVVLVYFVLNQAISHLSFWVTTFAIFGVAQIYYFRNQFFPHILR